MSTTHHYADNIWQAAQKLDIDLKKQYSFPEWQKEVRKIYNHFDYNAKELWKRQRSMSEALKYMEEHSCHLGGWPVVYESALVLNKLQGMVDMILKILGVPATLPVIRDAPCKPEERWVRLSEACFEWTHEASQNNLRLLFNKNFIRALTKQHIDTIFTDCARVVNNYDIEVIEDLYLDKLVLLRQLARTKKIDAFDTDVLKQFVQLRKQKQPRK